MGNWPHVGECILRETKPFGDPAAGLAQACSALALGFFVCLFGRTVVRPKTRAICFSLPPPNQDKSNVLRRFAVFILQTGSALRLGEAVGQTVPNPTSFKPRPEHPPQLQRPAGFGCSGVLGAEVLVQPAAKTVSCRASALA